VSKFDGKKILVTGASRGIGRAIAVAFAASGGSVAINFRSDEKSAADTLNALEGAGHLIVQADVSVADGAGAAVDQSISGLGGLDIVVNNAGIAPAGFFLKQSEEVWDDVMAVNVKAPATLARAAGREMIAQGSGKIINIASTSGILGKAMLVAYSTSKGALLQFTKALAAEWASKGVQVNAIAPGAFETDAQRAVLESPDILKRRLGKIPVRRMGQVGEIGPLICYLASPVSNFVTGSVFVIDGGESCKL